eukprot:6468743-Amphidinium_carterae.1
MYSDTMGRLHVIMQQAQKDTARRFLICHHLLGTGHIALRLQRTQSKQGYYRTMPTPHSVHAARAIGS